MTAYADPCDDCGTCLACGRPWCPNETPSPGEGDGLCVACWLSGRPHDVDGEECRESAREKAIGQGDV